MSGTVNPDYSILDEFKGTIVRPKTGLLYHGCLLLVAGAMLVLPLIYLVMLGALAWGVYYHAVHDWAPIMHFGDFTGGGRVMIVKFLIYFVPLFAGGVVLFFMVKPLLAGRPKRAQPLAMNPADNPLLYAFIAKICDIVGAPAPKRIDMDCQLNASARSTFRQPPANQHPARANRGAIHGRFPEINPGPRCTAAAGRGSSNSTGRFRPGRRDPGIGAGCGDRSCRRA